ncbi:MULTISPECIES: GFA family protein [Sphingobium]|uniref:GFA family protein n=1 Tax=Sphingobium TaxID=165695 RepID=UPI0015EB89B7|nr:MULTISPECIES: GFA family protein [Sphingobium]MCW2364327.1 hypothetical protein [Sphingobium sp. B10D3B]MCW2393736.1 hypothetical protein [Sphingobium sp. B8D3B]MCW2402276.1 hypothetical protein [Sphingobium sp. B10D7B]MCW2409255.1 hypothetical protein [Sphingobium xanthum]MCW2417249.1 hypothetical protein [Sphingobium sp. B8D3C]
MQSAAEGGCRCGKLRFRVTGAPLFTAACHCRGCQLMTASAFSLTSCYFSARFEVMAGEPVIGGLHGATRHFFCDHCLSWVFTRPEGMDEIVNVRTTLLDVPPTDPPFLETYTSEALPWAVTKARHSFETFPPMEQFQPLMAEFAGLAHD